MFGLFWRFILICTDLTNEFLDKNGPHLAAAVTYYALFSLLPLTLAIVAVMGYFVKGPALMETPIIVGLTSLIPVSKEATGDTVQVLVNTRHVVSILGIVGLVWASTTVFGAIRKGINAVWGIRKTRRFFHERFIDFAFTVGAGLALLAPIAIVSGIGLVTGVRGQSTPVFHTTAQQTLNLLVNILSPLASIGVFMVLYRYLPNTKVTFRDVWPGAVMAALAFEGAKWGFLWYTRTFPFLYNAVYGPLGALLALLTWVYVSAFILFYGALVTSRYSLFLSRKAEEKSQQILAGIKRLTEVETKNHG